MKKYLIEFICCILLCYVCFPVNAVRVIQDENEIVKIKIQSASPYVTEHEKYNFESVNDVQIRYLAHYLNSFATEEAKIAIPSDTRGFFVWVEYSNNFVIELDLYPHGLRINNDTSYKISENNYTDFANFLHDLKFGNIILPDTASFELSDWAKAEVDTAIGKGLVPKWNQIGYRESIDRLEVCQLLSNFLEQNGVAYEKSGVPFSDVGDTSITHLHQLGIVNGREDGLFHPYDYITREEFAKMLFLTENVVCDENTLTVNADIYVDDADVSDWAKESVYALTSLGIFKGNDNSEFCPKNNISKEQVILTLLRANKFNS